MRTVGYIGTAYVGAHETFLRLKKVEDSSNNKERISIPFWCVWTPTGFDLVDSVAQLTRAEAAKAEAEREA